MVSTAQDQSAIFAFMSDPANHGGAPVRRIDTHAASVFLAGDRAYKIKRAVRFPFLDYSTLERRKAACDAEMRVNRRFAPDLYRRVVPISRDATGSLSIDGAGDPAEWVLVMQRFDDTQTLDRLADAGQITDNLADRLGAVIAGVHADLPPADATTWIAGLGDIIAQNDIALRGSASLFPANDCDDLRERSLAMLDRVRPLLEARGRAGFVRQCHGDLHLGNIAMIDGQPLLFDAIEFDPALAAGDVLYDLAFLLMDLVERDLRRAANVVFNRYLRDTRTADHDDGLAALPLFMSMRAAIRAKVTAARANDAAAGEGLRRAARKYFMQARAFLSPTAPRLLAIGGLSGTGKSVLAAALAHRVVPEPGAVVLRSDVERKLMAGVGELDRLPASSYTPQASAAVYERLENRAARCLAAGHSVIVDAVFAQPAERAGIARIAARAGCAFDGLFLHAEPAVRLQRVGARRADASDADTAVVQRQQDYDLGAMDWRRIDAGGTPGQTLAEAGKALGFGPKPDVASHAATEPLPR